MTFLVIEGLDRTGKSTVAELYKKKGYEVVHMSAPDKKYKSPMYAGPSYLDDLLELVMSYDGKDVVFDRSHYGELIFPHVYNREPLLTEDDIDILREFEERNDVQRILMIDPDTNAHWKRCVDNKEPLSISQFKVATALFNKMAHKYGFAPKTLKDFTDVEAKDNKQISITSKQENPSVTKTEDKSSAPVVDNVISSKVQDREETELFKLEKANAIRDVIDKRIIKQKGGAFDKLEEEVKSFLKTQLASIFKDSSPKVSLSEDEVVILRAFCQRIKEKEKEGRK